MDASIVPLNEAIFNGSGAAGSQPTYDAERAGAGSRGATRDQEEQCHDGSEKT